MLDFKSNKTDTILFLIGFIILALGIYSPFIFGSKSLILDPRDVGADIIHIYFPTLKVYLEDGVGFWLNTYGLGTNLAMELPGYRLDPFISVVYLFTSDIESVLLVSQLIKLFLIALLFKAIAAFYVQDRFYATLGSLIFAFCSYNVIWAQHFFFSTGCFYFLLYFYTLELYTRKKNWYLLVIASALSGLLFYQFTMVALSVPCFLFFKKLYYNNTWSVYLKQLIATTFYTAFGLLVMGAFTIPYAFSVMQGARVGRNKFELIELLIQSKEYYVTALGRFLSSETLGHASKYFGYDNYYAAPLIFSSVLLFFLLPLATSLSNRNKKLAVYFLILFTITPLFLPFFGWILNLFQLTYCRFTFISIFSLVLAGTLILDEAQLHKKEVLKASLLGFSAIFSISFLLYKFFLFNDGEWANNHLHGPFYFDKVTHIKAIVFRVICFAALYVITLLLLQKRAYLKYGLLFICIAEMLFEYAPQWDRPWLNKGEASALYQKEQVFEHIYELNDSLFNDQEFYRYETTADPFFLSKNESLITGAPKVRMYQSNPPRRVVDLYHRLGIVNSATWINVLPPIGEQTIYQDLFDDLSSVKYYVKDSCISGEMVLKEFEDGNYLVLNEDYRKFGSVISNFSFIAEGTPKDSIAFHLTNGSNLISGVFAHSLLNARTILSEEERYVHESFGNDYFKGSIDLDSLSSVYFSIPFDQGWHAYVDGEETPVHNCNIAFSFINVDQGKHAIELRYEQPLFFEGIIVSIASVLVLLFFVFHIQIRSIFSFAKHK